MRAWLTLVAATVSIGVGCAGPGPYGFAQVYSPLDVEDAASVGSVPFDPSGIRRKPKQWKGKRVSAFVVVEEVLPQKGNADHLEVLVSLRTLQDRNLCLEPDESSCRVTVSEQSFATLRAVFAKEVIVPRSDERPAPVQPGSMLRLIGKAIPPEVETELPQIDATLVRHWPLKTYVTTAERENMRR
jgi:hypothetical protein